MTLLRFSAVCVLGAAVVGCQGEATFVEPIGPLAKIHWLNAVPDTGQLDTRVVDIASNAGLFDADFRGVKQQFYEPIEAGTRRIRVFISSTNPDITKTPIADTVFTFAENTGYKFINVGFARTGQTPGRTTWILVDPTPAAPPSGQLGVRVLNAATGLGDVDVRVTRKASDTMPDAPIASTVAYGQVTAYVNVPVDAPADTAQRLRLVIFPAGAAKTTTPLATIAANVGSTGVAGDPQQTPIGGSRASGTVFTAVVVPRSVAGSQAPQTTAFTTPSVIYFIDRRP